MNDRWEDWERLRNYARQGDQEAFAALVRRHLDLVYATALRKLDDRAAAEEVAQKVFTALARKAWQFGPDASLPAWLYRTALLESKSCLRSELRRRRREETAAQLGTTMKTPDQEPALRALVPLLDEGLLALREKDRTALLLRYYESRPLAEVGAALGISEDAARKRIASALELLSRFFQRRGFRTATLAATAAALQRTATAAPAGLASSVCQSAAIAAPVAFGVTSLFSRVTGLTKLQTAALSVSLAVLPIGWHVHQKHLAQQQALMAQKDFEQIQYQEQTLESELERLRSKSARIDEALARASLVRSSQGIPSANLDEFKRRLFGLLNDPNYRWQDNMPFVRVRKSDLKELGPAMAFSESGGIQDWGAEVLGLTLQERTALEGALRAHADAMSETAGRLAYLTNYVVPELAEKVSGKLYRSVWLPPVADGDSALSIRDSLRAAVAQVVGESRAELLLLGGGHTAAARWMRGEGLARTGAVITVCVAPDQGGEMEYGVYWNGAGGGGTSPNRNQVNLDWLPKPIVERFFDPWLQGMGITNIASRTSQ